MSLPEAWPQGSLHPLYPRDDDIWNSSNKDEEWLAPIERWPDLELALRAPLLTESIRVEWINSDGSPNYNYTQILRFAGKLGEEQWHEEAEMKERLLDQICDAANRVIRFGHRSYHAKPPTFSTCGGYRELLGRELVVGDHIRLRPLAGRNLMYKRTEYSSGLVVLEYLTEFSLEARS